jgi:hypothetical protein
MVIEEVLRKSGSASASTSRGPAALRQYSFQPRLADMHDSNALEVRPVATRPRHAIKLAGSPDPRRATLRREFDHGKPTPGQLAGFVDAP